MSTYGTLVVGASQAGLQLATSLRELGDTEPITLVGSEDHAPYQRPPLSKGFLAGRDRGREAELPLPDVVRGQRHRLVLRRAGHVRVLLVRRVRSSAELPGPRMVSSCRSTGSRSRSADARGGWTSPARTSTACGYLRDMDDAIRLRTQLPTATHVVVIGGGFIGLEAAAAARALGMRGHRGRGGRPADRPGRGARRLRVLPRRAPAPRRRRPARPECHRVRRRGRPRDRRPARRRDGAAGRPRPGRHRPDPADRARRVDGTAHRRWHRRRRARPHQHPFVVAAGDCTVLPHPHDRSRPGPPRVGAERRRPGACRRRNPGRRARSPCARCRGSGPTRTT